MGEDYPSETFRVLKEREIKEHGLTEGDVAHATPRARGLRPLRQGRHLRPRAPRGPRVFPGRTRRRSKVSKSREQDLERTLEQLVARADQTALPTLFVEGATDKLIIEGAWRALFPRKPSPVTVLSAGGTMQMKSLAAPGHRACSSCSAIVSCSRSPTTTVPAASLRLDKELHGGGGGCKQTNGTHWCLLAPTDEFRGRYGAVQDPGYMLAVHDRERLPCRLAPAGRNRRRLCLFGRPADRTIARPGRRQAGVRLSRRSTPADDAYFHLMAPTHEAKEAFAAWVADPARLTPTNFAAFGLVLNGLKDLLAQPRANGGQPPQQRRSA